MPAFHFPPRALVLCAHLTSLVRAPGHATAGSPHLSRRNEGLEGAAVWSAHSVVFICGFSCRTASNNEVWTSRPPL